MPDQAAPLRELKRFIDTISPEPIPAPEVFLAGIATPTPFFSLAVVIPDNIPSAIFPFRQWIKAIPFFQDKTPTIWDQAGTLPATVLLPDMPDHTPQTVNVESSIGELAVLPRQSLPTTIQRRQTADRIRFLRRIYKLFSNVKELWITIPMTEFKHHLPLVHASDAVVILIPARPDAVLRCYEAVKAVHLSGYYFPISLSEIPHDGIQSLENPTERIKLVAKKFLSLDLKPIMMVRSSILPNCGAKLGALHPQPSVPDHKCDFFRTFFERILYPSPEDRI